MARPRIEIDEHQLQTLASIGCTQEEMAAFFKCSVDTIKRNYAECLHSGVEQGKMSARRIIWDHFKKGHAVATKYVIHNILKERIEPEPKTEIDVTPSSVREALNNVSTEMILQIVKAHEKKAV